VKVSKCSYVYTFLYVCICVYLLVITVAMVVYFGVAVLFVMFPMLPWFSFALFSHSLASLRLHVRCRCCVAPWLAALPLLPLLSSLHG
jgi:hypothetical protein